MLKPQPVLVLQVPLLIICKLMRKVVGPKIGVKAAGGIRTKEQALAMLSAGANRIGASSVKTILQ